MEIRWIICHQNQHFFIWKRTDMTETVNTKSKSGQLLLRRSANKGNNSRNIQSKALPSTPIGRAWTVLMIICTTRFCTDYSCEVTPKSGKGIVIWSPLIAISNNNCHQKKHLSSEVFYVQMDMVFGVVIICDASSPPSEYVNQLI